MSFEQLTLHTQLKRAVEHQGHETPTEIQLKAIPHANAGHDLLASSKTGSGKTLAFLLPALQRILTKRALTKRDPRVLVLTPTRELANQVFAQLRMLIGGTALKAEKVLGGDNFNDQVKALDKHPHIVVATPGRFVDHLEKGIVHLNGLEMLILDEADRMLDLGFAETLNKINEKADHRLRQTLMFSATLEHADMTILSKNLLKSPKRVTVGNETEQHDDIKQSFYLSDHIEHKEALLKHFVTQSDVKQIIVFTATRKDTARLAELLKESNIKAVGLSGDLSQAARIKIMDDFGRGLYNVLITTDVASRGLDLLNVSHVINLDMPKHPEEYIHRIGRTGRAGFKGFALSIVGPKDWNSFKQVEGFMGQTFEFSAVEGLEAKFTGLKPKPKSNKHTGKGKKPDFKKAKKADHKKKSNKPTKKPKIVLPDFAKDEGFTPMRKKVQKPTDSE